MGERAKKTDSIAVLGAGGHSKVVIATLLASGFPNLKLFDDSPSSRGKSLLGVEVLGNLSQLSQSGIEWGVIAVGSNRDREKISSRLALRWVNVIHPQAFVHESVVLGEGSVVFAKAVIQPDVVIGSHGIINTSASIDHDCRLGSFVHIAPGATLAGSVTVGDGSLIGIGASAIPGVGIASRVVVGAASCVVSDLEVEGTYLGVPAKLKRINQR